MNRTIIRELSIPVSAIPLGVIISLSIHNGYIAIMVLALISFVGLLMRSAS